MKLHLTLGLYLTIFVVGVASSTDIQMCNLPVDQGTGEKMTLHFYYDNNQNNCLPFHYKGEGGNGNRFESEISCLQACSDKHLELYPTGGAECSLEKDQGRCHGRLLMFYYNSEEQACRTFLYGGCGGNGNRFESKEACKLVCAKSGRSGGSSVDSNPDVPSVNTGLIAGIVGGCVFVVAVISMIVLLVQQRNSKTRDRKKVPTSAIEVEMQ